MSKGPIKVKTPTIPVLMGTQTDQRTYRIVGLEQSDYMPVEYAGRCYNLATLTDSEAEFLSIVTPWVEIV
mgnify:CR=1 FL=1